ncbi:MAG: GNAT family N-acetyltransferase [Usitatibacteraceae bacterium]
MKIVAITNAVHDVVELEWLRQSEQVHRQLRPALPADYVGRMREVFASGADMAVCVRDGKVCGITVFRILEKTYSGRELYCDDLITDEALRSSGVGHALMQYMESVARGEGCDTFALDSGTQRAQAHKFYFREGMTVPAFHFSKPLSK